MADNDYATADAMSYNTTTGGFVTFVKGSMAYIHYDKDTQTLTYETRGEITGEIKMSPSEADEFHHWMFPDPSDDEE